MIIGVQRARHEERLAQATTSGILEVRHANAPYGYAVPQNPAQLWAADQSSLN
jgi:hypothetical protein